MNFKSNEKFGGWLIGKLKFKKRGKTIIYFLI